MGSSEVPSSYRIIALLSPPSLSRLIGLPESPSSGSRLIGSETILPGWPVWWTGWPCHSEEPTRFLWFSTPCQYSSHTEHWLAWSGHLQLVHALLNAPGTWQHSGNGFIPCLWWQFVQGWAKTTPQDCISKAFMYKGQCCWIWLANMLLYINCTSSLGSDSSILPVLIWT